MRRIVVVCGSIVFVDAMLFGAIIPLLPRFADEYDLTKLEAGVLLGAYGGGTLVGGLPAGFVVARIGPKRAVVAGLAFLCVASLVFALAGDPLALGLSRFFQGLSSSLTWAGALAWVALGTPREQRGEALGTVFGLAVFGFVVGPMFGGVADHIGIRPAFATVAVGSGLLAAGLAAVRPPAAEAQRPGAVARAFRDRVFVGGLWLNTLPALFFGAMDVLVPLRLDTVGWGALAIAAVFVVAGLAEVVANPVIGRVSDRRGRLLPVRLALASSIVVAASLAFATEPLLVAALVVAASVSFGGFYTPGMAIVADRSDRAGLSHGVGFGVTSTAWASGALVGPSLGGALAEAFGDAVPYLACAALCAATLVAATRYASRVVPA